jgi:uncharacterized Zn finger protein
MWYSFRPYVPVAKRRAQAAREVEKRKKKGHAISPVQIEGRTIARTFWGKAWCDNLESYSDYDNRLPRGRTYVRNGSVVDLQIQPGKITALVSGSDLYTISIGISMLPPEHWRAVKSRCAGQIGSLVELLQGKLSRGVMDVVTAHENGLFPKPREIKLACSCPDGARMCKHVAAVLYGVGARLDHQPELLFLLRKVDHLELIAEAVPHAGKKSTTKTKTLIESELAGVFGIELAEPEAAELVSMAQTATAKRPATGRRKAGKSAQHALPASPAPDATSTVGRARRASKVKTVGS